MQYNVTGIPLLGVFENGQLVKQVVGAKPKQMLLNDLAQWVN
jgi:thioredoxin 1